MLSVRLDAHFCFPGDPRQKLDVMVQNKSYLLQGLICVEVFQDNDIPYFTLLPSQGKVEITWRKLGTECITSLNSS